MNEVSLWYHSVLEALGYAIFHSLWQSVLLFFPLQLLLLFVKGAKQRYRLLFGSFSLLFVIFLITFCVEWNHAIEAQQHYLAWKQTLNAHATETTLTNTAWNVPEHWWQRFTGFYNDPHFKQILPFISICYMIGVLALGLRLAMSFRYVKSIRKDLTDAPEPLQERFMALVQLLNIKQKVTLYFSEKVNVPLMMGFLKPIVVLPIALINQLDAQQTEAILLHELAHVKRMDYLFNILQTVMEVLMFFNPMTWWFSSIIRKEREHCCDDAAVQHTQQPVVYAQALLQLELNKTRVEPAMAATGNHKKYSLLNRIKRIVEMKTSSKRSPQSILAAFTALMFVAAFLCYYSAVAQEKNTDTPKAKAAQQQSSNTTTTTTVITSDKDVDVPEAPEPPEAPEVAASPEAPEPPEMPDVKVIVRDAMKQADMAMKQADMAMKQADMKEVEASMKEAQDALNNVDWSVVTNSMSTASDALKAIDWDKIGNNINASFQSMKFLDKDEMKNAMKEVNEAMKQAKVETLNASKEAKAQMKSVQIIRQKALDDAQNQRTLALVEASRARADAYKEAQEARDEAIKATKHSQQTIYVNSSNGKVKVSNSNSDELLNQLEKEGLIDRNQKFSVSYKNNVMKVNDNEVDAARYQQYLPKGKDVKLFISGDKHNLSVSSQSK